MNIEKLVQMVLETHGPLCVYRLIDEASVHLPHRGRVWVATFWDENGKQAWKSTGQRDRQAAQIIADELEAEARRKRAAQPCRPKKPTIRVRPGSAERGVGLLTQKEVGLLMKISTRAVQQAERSAFEKIRKHPLLRQIWNEWMGREVQEADLDSDLSAGELAALDNLAQTPEERRVLRKLRALMAGSSSSLLWTTEQRAPGSRQKLADQFAAVRSGAAKALL